MGKVLPKKKFFRSAIYSPKLAASSHIDNVKYSLDHLIFSNIKESEEVMLKKRIKVVVIVTILLMIIGSYLSPKGKADVATFYPTACLGGWINPRNAEGEPDTKSNTDETTFTKDNSAMLPAGTQADVYCGNFVGEIEQNTKPTKIIVSLAWSKGEDAILNQQIVSDSFASSTGAILDSTSTDAISFTLSTSTEVASTTEGSSTTETVTPSVQKEIPAVEATTTQNVVTPTEEVTPPVSSSTPVSFMDSLFERITMHFVQKVFAEEIASTTVDVTTTPDTSSTTETVVASTTVDVPLQGELTSNVVEATTSTSTLSTVPSIIVGGNPEDESPNNFLEVLYTFDGVTWMSIGRVNEASMKYRTFEIPITATTSWNDLSQLQIKVRPLTRIDANPGVYLDGIKMEVLYETPVIHPHPDFVRDTLLQDKSDDGVRVVTIINSDTNTNEIWYTTIDEQGEYGVAPGSWVQVISDQKGFPYKLIDIYGQNIFLLDDTHKMLWVKNLQKESNDGIGITVDGTTTTPFTKSNQEEWVFEYHYPTKNAVVRIKN